MSSVDNGDKEKTRHPSDYKIDAIWKKKEMGGSFDKVNQPTAGARFEKELEKGEHRFQLYSLGTPNGVKVTTFLEELGIDYDAWIISIFKQDQFGSGFVELNPNSKIPAMYDYHPDYKTPIRVFESANILVYLAENVPAGAKYLPSDLRLRTETLNWVFWLQGSAPYIGGGFGHFFNYAPVLVEYAIDRFSQETKRLLDVLDKQLEGKTFVVGDQLTIADFCIYPWFAAFDYYKCGEILSADYLQVSTYKNVIAWRDRMTALESVKRGSIVNKTWGDKQVAERHSAKDIDQVLDPKL